LVSQQQPRMPLPIDSSLAAIQAALKTHLCLVIKAEPGAGKTTRVPAALLESLAGQILVLEPRRLAARLSAERIANERGGSCGAEVGYKIRFAAKASAATRLIFVTEGVFLRQVLDDPCLNGVAAVVIDEFHERHLHTDMALAIVRALQQGQRPDLKLIVMSATLATDPLARYLGGAQVFDIPGRTFPVAIEYTPLPEHAPVEEKVVASTRRILSDARCPGDVLIFLSGMQEIRRSIALLGPFAAEWGIDILALAADLPEAEQAKAFQVSMRRKVILSTNVAETSLTLPGVTGVIDLGTAKIAGHASWSGMPTLDVKKISQASAIQRSGRAGRVAAGVAYRVYAESDFLGRPAYTPPDIHRMDLAEPLLSALALIDHGVAATRSPGSWDLQHLLPWFEAPEAKPSQAAQLLLGYLGAVDAQGQITARGRAMAKLPLHPRLAAMVQRGLELACASHALAAACLIAEGMLLRRDAAAITHESSDVLFQMELIAALSQGRTRALPPGSDERKARQILNTYDQLARRLNLGRWPDAKTPGGDGLILCLLAGFPERVAKRRVQPTSPGSSARKERVLYNFCLGRGGILAEASVVQQAELILALSTAELSGQSADRGTAIYVAAELQPDHLLDSPAPLLSDAVVTSWSDDAERVDVMQRLVYGQLIVAESRAPMTPAHAAKVEVLLAQKLAERWPKPFPDGTDLNTYHARVEALNGWPEQAEFPHFSDDMLDLLQATICDGKRSFREIATKSLLSYILEQLPNQLRTLLDREAPGDMRLANGKTLKLTYEVGKPPFLTGLIQDFYGLKTTPSLTRLGQLTLHLLAPNRRPVQVTTDLAGFWQRHYPALRSEYGRRYPRYHWAEDPSAAKPFLYYNQLKAYLLPKP